jgi:hypothetical protein
VGTCKSNVQRVARDRFNGRGCLGEPRKGRMVFVVPPQARGNNISTDTICRRTHGDNTNGTADHACKESYSFSGDVGIRVIILADTFMWRSMSGACSSSRMCCSVSIGIQATATRIQSREAIGRCRRSPRPFRARNCVP